MEDVSEHPTCYLCRCEIRDDSDNWIVVDTAFCKFLVCETCCDEQSCAIEESEEEDDMNMSSMQAALEDVSMQMEDSSSEDASHEQ
jgi:hypothetical protein